MWGVIILGGLTIADAICYYSTGTDTVGVIADYLGWTTEETVAETTTVVTDSGMSAVDFVASNTFSLLGIMILFAVVWYLAIKPLRKGKSKGVKI